MNLCRTHDITYLIYVCYMLIILWMSPCVLHADRKKMNCWDFSPTWVSTLCGGQLFTGVNILLLCAFPHIQSDSFCNLPPRICYICDSLCCCYDDYSLS